MLGLTSARALQLWTVAYGYLAVATAVGVYAFLGKGLPDVVTHAHTYARLDSPIGYWNVLALMMVMGLCVALAIAGDRTTGVALRTLAAAAAVPMCFTFFFTFSRGGWIALACGARPLLRLHDHAAGRRHDTGDRGHAVVLTLWRLRGLDTLFARDDGRRAAYPAGRRPAALGDRGPAGRRRSAVGGGPAPPGGAVAALVGHRRRGGGSCGRRGSLGRRSGRYVQAHGGAQWVQDRAHALATDSESSSDDGGPGRLLTVTTNGRVALWREGVRQSRSDGAAGIGAGTFPFAHYRFRPHGGVVKHAHSQWFNALSELGVVGLVLFAVAMVLFVVAAVGNPFAHRRDPLHPLLVALQAGVIAFIVHMSWDWDWDMAAIGTLVFVFIAVCVSYRATRAADERRTARRLARDEPHEEPHEDPAGEASAVNPREIAAGEAAPADVACRRACGDGAAVGERGGGASTSADAEAPAAAAFDADGPAVARSATSPPSTRVRGGGAGGAAAFAPVPPRSAGRSGSWPARRWCCWR